MKLHSVFNFLVAFSLILFKVIFLLMGNTNNNSKRFDFLTFRSFLFTCERSSVYKRHRPFNLLI